MLLSTKIREMKSECGFSLALKLEKGSAALTCGPLRCALATALERARSRRVSSRRVSSCCSAGEEEQQETPAAAWCTVFPNILCILYRVFLKNTPSSSSPRHNGPAMGRDTSSPKIHEELSTPGKRQRTEWARGLEMDTRAKMSGVGAVRINVLAVLCRRQGFWGVGTKRVAYESIVRWDSSVHPICLCCNKKIGQTGCLKFGSMVQNNPPMHKKDAETHKIITTPKNA